jgi:hypothetical protein
VVRPVGQLARVQRHGLHVTAVTGWSGRTGTVFVCNDLKFLFYDAWRESGEETPEPFV